MKTDFGEALYLGEARERERERERERKGIKRIKRIKLSHHVFEAQLINITNTKWLSLTPVHRRGNHFITYIRKITTQPSSP